MDISKQILKFITSKGYSNHQFLNTLSEEDRFKRKKGVRRLGKLVNETEKGVKDS